MTSCAGGEANNAQMDDHIKSTSPSINAIETVTPTIMLAPLEPIITETQPKVDSQLVKSTNESVPGIEITTIEQAKPASDDSQMKQGKVFIDTVDFENGTLTITGNLPTPCHILRAQINDMEYANQKIDLTLYSLRDENMICIQSLAPFYLLVPLELKREGLYFVEINSEKRFDFYWPEKK